MSVIGALAVMVMMSATHTSGDEPKPEKPGKRGPLEGGWRLISYKLDGVEQDPMAMGQASLRVMTGTHFIWTTYDTKTKAPVVVGGGTYTLEGDVYREKHE